MTKMTTPPETADAIVRAVLDGLQPLRVDLVPPPQPAQPTTDDDDDDLADEGDSA